MATQLTLPDVPRTPMFVNGVMHRQWQEFFRSLFTRTGGGSELSNTELADLVNEIDDIINQDNLTANRLIYADGNKIFQSVLSLASWIAGTTNQVIVTDDGDGTITLSLPQDIHSGADPDFAGLNLLGDDYKILMGLASDSEIYFDGSNLIIDPKAVGTGIAQILGALGIQELSADPTDPSEGKATFWMSDGTATGDDGDILYKEQSGAVVEQGSLKWKDFTPASITLNTGTLAAGTVADVQTMFDGNVYHVDEVTGAPGYDIEFNFTSIDRVPTFVVCRWIYDGSSTHYVTWDIWNYTTSAWDQLRMFKTSEAYFASMAMYIPRASNGDYVDGSGNAMVRVYHHTAGNASHDIQIDYVGLTHSLQGMV